MKLTESRELTSARRLLSEFEGEMTSPNAATRVSEALSLLSGIVEAGGAEGPIARNVVGVYAAKAVASVDATLARPGEASAAELRHWQELLTEFGLCGFESSPVTAALSKLSKRLATRYVSQLTQTEKEVLLRKLEQDQGEERP
jgi:hypothetical protein